jgi:nitrite reductase/ring-hydroxylating ferredoxin subunit
MKVKCTVSEVTLTNSSGIEVDSVEATCEHCGHVTRSYGTGEASRKRCLVLMREECPLHEENYYIDDGG